VSSATHVITFGCQLTKLQKKCCTINVIISDEAKTLHFVGQMYRSNYFTEEQMTKYEMQSDPDKAWTPTLDHFSLLFVQWKAYGNDRAAYSGFRSAATMFVTPSDCTVATITSNSDATSQDLYIESLEESLAIARDYVARPPHTTPLPIIVDPMATLQVEMDAQRKQFDALLQQNADLVAAIAKTTPLAGNANNNNRPGRNTRTRTPRPNLRECPHSKKMCTHESANCFQLATNADKCPPGWRVAPAT
jgi:hypothetical protein